MRLEFIRARVSENQCLHLRIRLNANINRDPVRQILVSGLGNVLTEALNFSFGVELGRDGDMHSRQVAVFVLCLGRYPTDVREETLNLALEVREVVTIAFVRLILRIRRTRLRHHSGLLTQLMPSPDRIATSSRVFKEIATDQTIVGGLLVQGNHNWDVLASRLFPHPLQNLGRSLFTLLLNFRVADVPGILGTVCRLSVVVDRVDPNPDCHPSQRQGATILLHIVLLLNLLDVGRVWIGRRTLNRVQPTRIFGRFTSQPIFRSGRRELLPFLEDVGSRRKDPLGNISQAAFEALQIVLVFAILIDVHPTGLADLVVTVFNHPLVIAAAATRGGVITVTATSLVMETTRTQADSTSQRKHRKCYFFPFHDLMFLLYFPGKLVFVPHGDAELLSLGQFTAGLFTRNQQVRFLRNTACYLSTMRS